MSHRKKRTTSMTDAQSTLNISTGSESEVEMQLSPHVTASNQLIGKLLPAFSPEKGTPKPKSRPLTSQRKDLTSALVIPTAANEVSDSWEGKTLPKVNSQLERTITKGNLQPQISPVPPKTAREMSPLKLVMKGKLVPKGLGCTQSSVEKASKLSALMMEETKLPIAPPTTRMGTEISEIFFAAVPIPRTLALKPALLPCVGNVKSLPLTEKKKKLPKYKVSLKKSKTKLEPIVAEKKTHSVETEIETHEERKQSSDMEEAQCAVRMLVQEAEVLTQDESRPSSMKTKVKQKSSSSEIKEEIRSDTATRSVDQIIESLWEQVHSETLSESDRRIQEIMNRVMSRGISQKIERFQEISGEEDLSEKSEKSSQKQEIVEEKELKEEEEEEKETLVSLEYKDDKEEMTGTETEPTISEEDDVCITAVAGPWDIESFAEEDFNKLKAELNLPLHVSREDILSLKGHHVKTFSQIPQSIVKKSDRKKKIEMSFLSSWNDGDIITGGGKTQDSESKAIISKPNVKQHHFCTVTSEFEIEFPFTHVAWKYHTPNKFSKDFPIKDCRQSILIEAERFDKNTDIEENYHENLEDWLHQTEKMFTDIELTVKGNHAPTIMTNDIHFWTLSPPKLHIQPAIIKQMMCPLYYGSFNPGRYISFEKKKRTEKKTAVEKLLDNFIDKDEEEIEQLLKERLLEQKSESSRDLTAYAKEQCPNLDLTESIPHQVLHRPPPLSRLLEIQKCHSDTFCIKHMDQSPPLLLPSDYESLNKEMQEHKKSICEMNRKKQEQEELKKSLVYFDEENDSLWEIDGLEENEKIENIPISKLRKHFKERKSNLKRSQSVICLPKGKLLPSPKVERRIKRTRSKSLSFSLDLQQLTLRPRSVSGIFNPKKLKYKTALLEEKIPSRPKSEEFSESISDKSSALMEDELSIYSSKRTISTQPEAISSILPSDVSKIELMTDDPRKLELNKKIWAEIELLTKNIEESPDNWVFDTCRRGVLYRKVGELDKSFEDLNRVIESESVYFDAYWHRHFLYVLRGDYPSALDDLNFIQERKPTYKVFMALGVLYENMKNKNLALANYTKATQIDSTNHLAYFYRAKLYEKIGNLNYAIGDYIKTAEKNPKHTEALKKQAEYFLKIKNWNVAISKITRLLELINDPEAFLIRAEAFIGLKIWKHALCDLSTAIHLGPSLWKAFYLRGCLLKNNPKEINRAVMDFSISLLLNDTAENISCYNYRGILYVNKKCPEQAASDFASILKFEPTNINALLNLGLIYMKNFQSFTIAINLFTNVIALNPFHIKAYQFRAQAYTKLYKYMFALRDYTRIIHIEPNNYKYYFFLGDIFLKIKRKDIAGFFIKLISNVDLDIGSDMSAELATVYSYLNKSDQALTILYESLENNPGNPNLLMSLGKAQLQAKQYEKCLTTFQDLKAIMISKKSNKWPNMADEVFYNLGLVYMGLKDYKKALVAFNRAIDINPRHALCFYHRGLTKIHLNYAQCVTDFNKALSIDPKYFEAYMSRAAYYAMKKNYPKAILNCNEGLKIYKNSVRALLYRGSIKYFIGAYKFAVVDLTKAIKLKEDCALAFFNRAICFEALEEYENALCDYSIVHLISDELDYSVFINRGCLYFKMEDFDNARQDFREALKLKPEDCKIIHAWGLCLHKLGKLEEAKEMFTKCLRINCQFSDAFISRGNIYMDYVSEAETVLASYDYQRAIITKPDDVLARICLAYSFQVLGKFQKAWHQFSEAFIIDPNCEDALEGRAAVCLQMGDTYAAFQDLNAAIRINPTAVLYNNRGVVNQYMKCLRDALTDYKYAIELDPQYALAYYNAGNIYLHGRFFQQALKYFNQAVSLDPNDECALINRAVTKVMLKDIAGASSDFEQALCMCPYYAHIYFNRGNLYASLQMYELAEKDFTTVLEILPNDPLTLVQRANVYGKLGRKNSAIADYRKAMEVKEELQHQ